jgi:hypothetical protein
VQSDQFGPITAAVARQVVIPQGFTLSMTGVFAILPEHRPDPGPTGIWLFVVGSSIGYALVAATCRPHRSVGRFRACTDSNCSTSVRLSWSPR